MQYIQLTTNTYSIKHMYITCLSHDPSVSLVGLWCLMPLSTLFSAISWQSDLFGKETTDMWQVHAKLYHIK